MKIISCILMAGLGAAGSLAFAPFGWWPMAIASIGAAYYICVFHRNTHRRASLAMFWGAGWCVANFYWTASAIPQVGLRFAVWGILAALGAVVFGMPFMAAARQSAGWRRALVFATGAAGALYIREVLINPWNPLANIALGAPGLAASMSVVGAIGLTFVIAGCVAAVIEAIIPERDSPSPLG
ncbi:MAG: hypothetical protein LBL46_02395, partial [Rickettsiales bacterium]|nr:hypothetical protein [Rickettsiales bacterium]